MIDRFLLGHKKSGVNVGVLYTSENIYIYIYIYHHIVLSSCSCTIMYLVDHNKLFKKEQQKKVSLGPQELLTNPM